MKKILIFGVAIIIILWYWYSKKGGNGSVDTKSNTSLNIDVPGSDKIEVEEAKPIDKRKLYEQEAYEAQVREQKKVEQSRQDPNVVAYSLNSGFEKQNEITIYGPDNRKVENTTSNTQPSIAEKDNISAPSASYTQKRQQSTSGSYNRKPTTQKAPIEEPENVPSSAFNSTSFNSQSFSAPASSAIDENAPKQKETTDIINAVVFGDHSIKNGEPIRMRLRQDAIINGVKVSRNTIFSVPSSFSGRRLILNVTQMPGPGGQNIPTALKVYDLDNMEGISVNANLEGKIVKREGNNIVGNAISQATGFSAAGNAVNSIFNQMANGEVPIVVPAGHEVTLRFTKR